MAIQPALSTGCARYVYQTILTGITISNLSFYPNKQVSNRYEIPQSAIVIQQYSDRYRENMLIIQKSTIILFLSFYFCMVSHSRPLLTPFLYSDTDCEGRRTQLK